MGRTCPVCVATGQVHCLRAAAVYSGLAKELVGRLKFSGSQSAAREMAALLVPLLPTDRSWLIMPVPTATRRVRSRGYDQARLLAREVSLHTGLPYAECLVRSGQTHQVGASRERRLWQLQDSFRATGPAKIRGRHILLIDDVVTTGATLEAAARTLRMYGAVRIEAAVFCVA